MSGGRSRIEVLVDGRGVYSWYADAWDQNGGIALVSRGVRPRKLLHERKDERFVKFWDLGERAWASVFP